MRTRQAPLSRMPRACRVGQRIQGRELRRRILPPNPLRFELHRTAGVWQAKVGDSSSFRLIALVSRSHGKVLQTAYCFQVHLFTPTHTHTPTTMMYPTQGSAYTQQSKNSHLARMLRVRGGIGAMRMLLDCRHRRSMVQYGYALQTTATARVL